MTETKEREAACACGQLKLRLAGDPFLVSSCHCIECQRRTGALFGSSAFFKSAQMVATEGEHRAYRRRADSGNWLVFHFCPNCGSSLFWQTEGKPENLTVAVGAFADPAFPAPNRTVWTQTKHEWLAFPPDIPGHPKSPV